MSGQSFQGPGAVIERHIYRHDGLDLVAWIVRPDAPGPFPVMVVNHGSGLSLNPDGTLGGDPALPTVDPAAPGWFELARAGWLFVFPEGRGYGGSEGPDPRSEVGSAAATIAMLGRRAEDANAAVAWVGARPDADGSRVAIAGASHGGVVALLAGARRPTVGVVAQATGAAYGNNEWGAVTLANAAARIRAPVLFQHMRTDTLVPMRGARSIYEWSSRLRPRQQWRDYAGVPGIEGHFMFRAENRAQWFPDYRDFLRGAFSGGVAEVPEDAAERMEAESLAFALPGDVNPGASRWTGRFGTGPGSVDSMLVLDGDEAVYAWKEADARGWQRAPVSHRGDALVIAPWPGITITYAPLPGDGFEATYVFKDIRATAVMQRVGP